MRADPNAEWCHNCDRPGHSELRCPYEECVECDGEGVITVYVSGPDRFGNHDHDEVECLACDGKGYIIVMRGTPEPAPDAHLESQYEDRYE
jgi:DnaJ-class molecular chaperone